MIRFMPLSKTADIEILASAVSSVAPNGTYLEKVNAAKSIISVFDGRLEEVIGGLNIFTPPIDRADRLAASEVLNAKESSQ